QARPRPRTHRRAAGSSDVQRRVGIGLRPPRAAGAGTSHHPGVRQHAAAGRARGAASVRAVGQGTCRRAPRQLGEGAAPRRRATLEARRVVGAGRHRLAGAGHRHRRRGPGLPARLAAFLQRAGRSGHHVGGTPKARLFPTTRDDLVECAALLDAVRRGELDALVQPPQPLDVLAQQLVAEVACREWDEDALYALVRGAYPYRDLARADFDAVVRMLADGFTTRRGARAAYLHRDAVHRQLRARRGARLVALTSGGAIPDTADYLVVLEPQATVIGSVHEDFAVESLAGDIFQLGNTSYRILRVERDRLRVEDAHGVPPSIPFWLGEAPGRTDELSFAVSRLREELDALLEPLSHRERGRGEGSVLAEHSGMA